ncbi:MAG TPA: peptidoglycan-binding domain-containing protein [Vicinamibacteria bacterium]|nr:peptidoglycan-binding domain-containing protein [Vicinamibacteria bacterium]
MRTALMVAAAVATASAAAADVTVPKGTYLELRSTTAFDSETSKKGDTFSATVIRGLWVEGQHAIPAGSTVTGTIKSVRNRADGSKSAAMGVRFEALTVAGRTYPIAGVLVSLKADERKKILEQQGKISTGRHVDVVLIGLGTEPGNKVDTLVGISGADRDDLSDDWAKSGLGPATVHVSPGTSLTMQLDKSLSVPRATGSRAADDRNIFVSSDTIKGLQWALKGRKYYTGEPTGNLDQRTRDALARFQLDQGQPATGDADEATVTALGIQTAGTVGQ